MEDFVPDVATSFAEEKEDEKVFDLVDIRGHDAISPGPTSSVDVMRHEGRRPSSQIWDYSSHGKLYGRVIERTELLQAYRRVREPEDLPLRTQFVIIRGDTGIGKTTLALSLRSTVVVDGGFFAMGKFDHLQRPEPHAALVTAFTRFASSVLQRGEDSVRSVREAVMAASRC
jgi:AAA ATPase domain